MKTIIAGSRGLNGIGLVAKAIADAGWILKISEVVSSQTCSAFLFQLSVVRGVMAGDKYLIFSFAHFCLIKLWVDTKNVAGYLNSLLN